MVVYIFFEGVYVYSRRMFDHHRVFFFSSIVEILRNWFFRLSFLLLFRLHFPLLCRGIFIDSVSLSPFFFLLFLYADSGIFIDFVLFTSVFFFFFSIAEFYTFGENENRNFLSIFRRVGFDGRIDFVAKRGTKWNSSRIKAKRFQIPFPFLERDPRGIKYCTVINFMHVG